MLGLGWQELVIILVIIMVIFGAGRLPEVVKSLGMGVKEFKQEVNAPADGLATASSTTVDGVDSAAVAQGSERTKVRADEI
jgi:sec-independent protein translocase protein TatA